jgi:hypothetical protein
MDNFLLVIYQYRLDVILPLCEASFQKPTVFVGYRIQVLNLGHELFFTQKKEASADIRPLGPGFVRHYDYTQPRFFQRSIKDGREAYFCAS